PRMLRRNMRKNLFATSGPQPIRVRPFESPRNDKTWWSFRRRPQSLPGLDPGPEPGIDFWCGSETESLPCSLRSTRVQRSNRTSVYLILVIASTGHYATLATVRFINPTGKPHE